MNNYHDEQTLSTGSQKPWNSEELDALIQLFMSGYAISEIAAELKRDELDVFWQLSTQQGGLQ